MSLHPQPLGEIPSHTILVAQSAFPKGNIYLRMRDELGVPIKLDKTGQAFYW